MPIEVATVSIFTPFNFAVLLSSRNSQNIGHANMKGFTVYVEVVMFCSGGQCNAEEPLCEPWPCEELLTAS